MYKRQDFGDPIKLYFEGDMEAAIPLSGQVAGRIESIEPVEVILQNVKKEFFTALESLSRKYL